MDEKGVIGGFYNPDMLDNLENSKCRFVSVNEIVENPKNEIYDLRPLEKYKTMIEEEGLLQPPVVYKKNGKYVLITGHNRFKAIKALFKENVPVMYFGTRLENNMPVLVHKGFKDDNEELMAMWHTNDGRALSEGEAYRISLEVERIYKEMFPTPEDKPAGFTKRQLYSRIAPFDGKTVERYLSKRNEETVASSSQSVEVKVSSSIYEKTDKALSSALKHLSRKEDDSLSIEEVQELKRKLKAILKALG